MRIAIRKEGRNGDKKIVCTESKKGRKEGRKEGGKYIRRLEGEKMSDRRRVDEGWKQGKCRNGKKHKRKLHVVRLTEGGQHEEVKGGRDNHSLGTERLLYSL